VAHDLRLGDLGQLRRLGASEMVGEKTGLLRHVELGRHECAPAGLGLLEDRDRVVALHRRLEHRAAVGAG
jgi:hypothetical protein